MAGNSSDDAFARAANQMGAVTLEQIESARQVQASGGVPLPLAETLIQQGVITLALKENIEKKLQAAQQGGIKQLGNYKLVKKLGEGGMGAVFLADDVVGGRRVALKVLPKKHASNSEFVSRFRREAQATGKLNHVNIVTAFTVGEELGNHYYAMEYCDGEPLDACLKREKTLAWAKAVEIVTQVARGLKHAHEHGFIHRDIKPANIFITSDGVAKILDLGLSKSLTDTDQSFNTQTGVAMGTPHYISPEQARGDKGIDGRTDIYSLGATLYHLVTGETPFTGSTAAVIMMKHLSDQLPNPQDVHDGIPDGVVHVIQKMMAKEPLDRYAQCTELLQDLELVIDGKSPSSAAIDVGKSSIAMPRARRTKGAEAAPRKARNAGAVPRGGAKESQRATPSKTPMYIAGAVALGILVLAIVIMSSGKKTETASKENPEPEKNPAIAAVEPVKPKENPVEPPKILLPLPPPPALPRPDLPSLPPPPAVVDDASKKNETSEVAAVKPIADAEGFVPIFNGRDLTGWDAADPGIWSVKDGAIAANVAAGAARNFWLIRPGIKYADFELRLLCKYEGKEGNAGIGYRGKDRPAGELDGYQFDYNTDTDNPHWREECGHLFTGIRRFAIMPSLKGVASNANGQDKVQITGRTGVTPEDMAKSLKPDGWNELTLIVQGNHFIQKLNGLAIVDFTDANDALYSPSGLLCLKIWRFKEPILAQFKDIRLKVLDGKQAVPDAGSAVSAPPAAKTIDLLALIDPVKDRVTVPNITNANNWEKNGASLTYKSDGRSGKVASPVAIRASKYEIELEYKRLSGRGQIHIDLPDVAGRILPILLDQPNRSIQISGAKNEVIGKMPASAANAAKIRLTAEKKNGQFNLAITVNGEPAAQWSGLISQFTKSAEYPADYSGQPITSVFCLRDSYEITAWNIRVIEGNAVAVRAETASLWRPLKSLDQWEPFNSKPGFSVTKETGGGVLMHGHGWLKTPGVCSNVLIRAAAKKVSGNNFLFGLRGAPNPCYCAWFDGGSGFGIGYISNANTYQGLKQGNAARKFDDFCTVTFAAFGERLQVYANDDLIIEAKDSRLANGLVAIGNEGDIIFKDIQIMDAPAGIGSIEELVRLAAKTPPLSAERAAKP